MVGGLWVVEDDDDEDPRSRESEFFRLSPTWGIESEEPEDGVGEEMPDINNKIIDSDLWITLSVAC